MRLGDKAELGFGDAALSEVAPAALIDGGVDASQQRVGRLARIPAQRRAAGFDKRRVIGKGRVTTAFRHLERQPRHGRLTDPRRPVENDVLRVRRGNLGEQRTDGSLLPDDLAKGCRA